jgi:hypothetical protein
MLRLVGGKTRSATLIQPRQEADAFSFQRRGVQRAQSPPVRFPLRPGGARNFFEVIGG